MRLGVLHGGGILALAKIAHCAQNVSFVANNVNSRDAAKRSEKGAAAGRNRIAAPLFGRQKKL